MTRHISKVHKNEDIVRSALEKPRAERNRLFQSFKKEGINQFNVTEINQDNPCYARERKKRKCDELIKCSNCHGFYSKSFFSRHKHKCGLDNCTLTVAVPVEEIENPSIEMKEIFYINVVKDMRDDEIGRIVKNDPIILLMGARWYAKVKRRRSKKDEVVNKVRSDMRRLGHLYKRFLSLSPSSALNGNAVDMFMCNNFVTLEDAIEEYTDTNLEVQKAGLKNQLFYLLVNSANKLVGHYMVENNNQLRKEAEDFIVLINHRKDEVFGDATYDLNEKRNVTMKKPSSLSLESDVTLIRDHVLEIMKKYSNPFHVWDLHSFKELRDNVCARLTMFNGRRGGEPARLMLREWKEALDGAWIDEQRDLDNESGSLITYQNGKGNHAELY